MNDIGSPRVFLTYLTTFARLAKAKLFILPPLMLVVGIFEGVGIILFLPVIEWLVAGSGTTGSTPQFFGGILTALHLTTLPRILSVIIALFLGKFAATVLQQVVIQRMTRDLYRSLAGRIIRGWTSSEYREFYLSTTTGTLTNALVRELWTFLGAFSYASLLLVSVVYIAVYLTGSFLLDPRTTSIAVAFGIVAITILQRWVGLAGTYSIQFSDENVLFQDRLIEFLQHFKYLKATARFPMVEQRLYAIVERMTMYQYRMGIVGATMSAIPEPFAVLVFIAFLYGSVAVFGNAFATTAVLALLLYRTLMRILTLQSAWQKFVGCSGSLRAVTAALIQADAHPEPRGNIHVETITRAIAFDGVHFTYSDRPILTDITLRFPTHRTVALVGPSGGGKSTIVDLLTGVLKPTAGRITIDGTDYQSIDPVSLRRLVGYVAQEIVMFNDTIANNVALWSPTDDFELRQRCTEASCDFIEQLPQQYDTPVGERGIALSVGQRQRIAIARELFRDPRILIFDEATSALDAESEEVIRQHIARLSGTRTIVLIAHRLSTIRHADYLYVIDQGRVVEDGTFDALYGNPQSAFRVMCDLQRVGAAA